MKQGPTYSTNQAIEVKTPTVLEPFALFINNRMLYNLINPAKIKRESTVSRDAVNAIYVALNDDKLVLTATVASKCGYKLSLGCWLLVATMHKTLTQGQHWMPLLLAHPGLAAALEQPCDQKIVKNQTGWHFFASLAKEKSAVIFEQLFANGVWLNGLIMNQCLIHDNLNQKFSVCQLLALENNYEILNKLLLRQILPSLLSLNQKIVQDRMWQAQSLWHLLVMHAAYPTLNILLDNGLSMSNELLDLEYYDNKLDTHKITLRTILSQSVPGKQLLQRLNIKAISEFHADVSLCFSNPNKLKSVTVALPIRLLLNNPEENLAISLPTFMSAEDESSVMEYSMTEEYTLSDDSSEEGPSKPRP